MKSFVLHDESYNTQGFRMLTAGADLTEFRKNPVLLLNHNDWNLPPGRWENIRIEGTQILADPVFDENDPEAMKVKNKVDNDFVRAASIGAWTPEKWVENYDPATGITLYTVEKWVVREASICTIPSNHNALALYDRETGKIIESEKVLKLFDRKSETPFHSDMQKLAVVLRLADTSTEEEITAAVQAVMSDNDRLTSENAALTTRIDEFNLAAREALTAQSVALVDAAIADGRIDAKARENFLKLFDNDFDAAKASLEAIPMRRSITEMLERERQEGNTELADLINKSWDELDKAGKLSLLRSKYPDVYGEKFEKRFKKPINA